MRIAHILNSLETGGAEVVATSLCRVQREQGHQVSVHCLFRAGVLGEKLAAEGFRVQVHFGGGRLGTMRNLYRAFRAEPWDVGHCHNVAATVWAAPMLRAAGVPAIVATRHSLVRPPYDFGDEAQFSIAARFCFRVVGVCQATSDNISRAPLADPARVVTIYNGATPPPGGGKQPAKNGFTFVTLARLAPPKDHSTLLRAFARARRECAPAALWIVGDGPLRGELEKLSAELGLGTDVSFWGERLNPGDFLAAADAFVLSSLSEGLPMSLLEAMSIGLPAIVTDVGGMAEVVRKCGLGRVVPSGDIEGLASAMLRCASEPSGEQERERIRGEYRRDFALEAMAEGYLRLYHQALAPRGAKFARMSE